MFVKTAKISRKGQITLPKAVREKLQTDTINIVMENGMIRLEPVRDVGGSLKDYASKSLSAAQAREQAWQQAVHEKHLRS